MAEKAEKTSKGDDKLKNYATLDVDGDIAFSTSERGKMVNIRCRPTQTFGITSYVLLTYGIMRGKGKGKGKVHVLAIALLTCFFKTRSGGKR